MKSHQESVNDIATRVNGFFDAAFSSVTITGNNINGAIATENPCMVVCTHRSQVDYFFAGISLHNHGFREMRWAAGDNLTKLPFLGKIFNSLGAFTVVRDKGFERNYVKNLCKSVIDMMESRKTVVLFPEGGRSYSGAMLEIKSGVLGAAILLQARNPAQDVFIYPMAVSYAMPPDSKWFELLLRGKTLRKKGQPFVKRMLGSLYYYGADLLAFFPFFFCRKFKRKYDDAYIDYGDAVSVRSIVNIEELRSKDSRDEFFSHRAAMQKVADYITVRFKELYRVLPHHVVAAICAEHQAITIHTAAEHTNKLISLLREQNRNMKTLDTLLPEEILRIGIEFLTRKKVIRTTKSVIVIRNSKLLDYFAAPVHDTTKK